VPYHCAFQAREYVGYVHYGNPDYSDDQWRRSAAQLAKLLIVRINYFQGGRMRTLRGALALLFPYFSSILA